MKRDVSQEAIIRALNDAQVKPDTFARVCVFPARTRIGYIEMTTQEAARALIAMGKLPVKLGNLWVDLKLSEFAAEPPKGNQRAQPRNHQLEHASGSGDEGSDKGSVAAHEDDGREGRRHSGLNWPSD